MADSNSDNLTPWKNGYYHARSTPSMLYKVEGENIIMHNASGKSTDIDNDPMAKGTWKYGDFGEAHPDVSKESGKSRYNVQMYAWGGMFTPNLVLSDDGEKLTLFGMTNCVDVIEWMSDEEFEKFINSGDPADAYPHPYKVQPGKEGKLLWLSGAPGLGKSTTGMLLGKTAGYVYYEADAFSGFMNPYVSTDVDEPTLAMFGQKFLKNVPQERIDTLAKGTKHFLNMIDGKEYDFDPMAKFYTLMAKDIEREQKRIGGDFAIAQAVPTRKCRDHIRGQLGSNLVFAVLHMSKEDQLARIKARHGDEEAPLSDMLTKCYDIYEPAGDDEPNTIHVLVTNDMTRDDVAQKVIRLLNEFCK